MAQITNNNENEPNGSFSGDWPSLGNFTGGQRQLVNYWIIGHAEEEIEEFCEGISRGICGEMGGKLEVKGARKV